MISARLIYESIVFKTHAPRKAGYVSLLFMFTLSSHFFSKVTEEGIEPKMPKGERFTVSGAHHLPNSVISSQTGITGTGGFEPPYRVNGIHFINSEATYQLVYTPMLSYSIIVYKPHLSRSYLVFFLYSANSLQAYISLP